MPGSAYSFSSLHTRLTRCLVIVVTVVVPQPPTMNATIPPNVSPGWPETFVSWAVGHIGALDRHPERWVEWFRILESVTVGTLYYTLCCLLILA